MAQKIDTGKVMPPGKRRHKCPRCKGPHQSYYNYPTICNGINCFENRDMQGARRK